MILVTVATVFLADVMAQAVWPDFRSACLRMVEDMLSARGIIVGHETVLRWAEKFERDFAGDIRRRAPPFGDKWH